MAEWIYLQKKKKKARVKQNNDGSILTIDKKGVLIKKYRPIKKLDDIDMT